MLSNKRIKWRVRYLSFFALACLGTLELPLNMLESCSESLKDVSGMLEEPTEFWESLIARVRASVKGALGSLSFEAKTGIGLALKLLGPLLYGLGGWLITRGQKE